MGLVWVTGNSGAGRTILYHRITGVQNNGPNLPSAGSSRAQPGMLSLCYGPS